MEKKSPSAFRTSVLKVTVNLNSAFGAHTRTVAARRTPLDYHVHNSFHCSRSIVEFVSFFSIPQPHKFLCCCWFFFPQEIG